MSVTSRLRLTSHALSKVAVVGAIAGAGVLLSAIPALAHISVTPGSAQAGSAAVLTFHVPNEETKAYATQVDMQLPTDHPIAQLLVKPVAGWTISVKTVTLAKPLVTDDGKFTQAVAEVIWSGGKIAPGQFQDFSLSADPLPQGVSQLAFKTVQTYSNGDVVRWIDLPQPGQPEPDHPAPTLALTTGTTAARPAVAATASPGGGSDAMARGIGAAGLAAGLLGLGAAGLSWRRGKAAVPAAAALNGQDPGTAPAAKRVAEPRPAQAPARGAPKRQGTSSRRKTGR